MKEPFEILEEHYQKAIKIACNKNFDIIPDEVKEIINPLILKIESDKSLVQVIVTSLLKKIISPEQDIRFHMAKFSNGYSARGLDTKVTTPFFKKYFPKYANKETAFLTKATRAEVIWTLDEGEKLPLRSRQLVKPFLELIDKIQNNTVNLKNCLIYTLAKLYFLSQSDQIIFDNTIELADFSDVININTVIQMLSKHFDSRLSSRLPVIAIFSVYKQLFKTVKRFDNKVLRPLNVHTSSDKHGYGDVEIWNINETPFEMVEVKHKIPIDRNMIFDLIKKSENTTIQRYYILTTYENCFMNSDEEEYINKFILKIKKERNLEIIANGIIYSLKYYLRFIEDYHEFLKTYTDELIADAKKSTEVKEFHLKNWQKILKKHSNL
ncbi:MAG: DNA methyltransferase [Desulfamplus sp.]|nr:DNA methyltransferase [Desulfamplus sp.]